MAAEDIPMRDPILRQRIDQRHGHMVLPRNICETLWPIFSRKNLICHIKKKKKKSLAPTWSIERDRNPIVSPTSQPRSQARRRRVSLDGRSRRASSTL
jgi:hypothetical protein